jgi:hypothetical protein
VKSTLEESFLRGMMWCINYLGPDKMKPPVIGSSRALGTMQHHYNKKAWMTGTIFHERLLSVENKMMNARRCKIVLLINNCTPH